MRKSLILLAAALLMISGCRYRLPALKPPKFDPDGAAAAAMEQYDTNSDGQVDKTELKAAPGISFALGRIDANDDGSVTAEELSTMIQEKWLDAGGGIMRVSVEIYMNRRPLDGATVTFEPERFLGDVIHPAMGETDAAGYTPMSMAEEDMPHENVRSGVGPGLYLVRISKEVNGKEMVPAKYNTETTLGIEVATRASYMPGSARFDLKK